MEETRSNIVYLPDAGGTSAEIYSFFSLETPGCVQFDCKDRPDGSRLVLRFVRREQKGTVQVQIADLTSESTRGEVSDLLGNRFWSQTKIRADKIICTCEITNGCWLKGDYTYQTFDRLAEILASDIPVLDFAIFVADFLGDGYLRVYCGTLLPKDFKEEMLTAIFGGSSPKIN